LGRKILFQMVQFQQWHKYKLWSKFSCPATFCLQKG
jgi:hypothetical protein